MKVVRLGSYTGFRTKVAARLVQTKAMSDPIMMRRRRVCPVCTMWVIAVTDASVSTAELRLPLRLPVAGFVPFDGASPGAEGRLAKETIPFQAIFSRAATFTSGKMVPL